MTALGIVVGVVLSISVVLALLSIVDFIFASGLSDLIISGFNVFAELVGSANAMLMVGLFTVGGIVLVIRFIMSWLGENPGHSANK